MSATTRRHADRRRAGRAAQGRPRVGQASGRAAAQLRGLAALAEHPAALSPLLAGQPAADRRRPADRDPRRGVSQVAGARLRRPARRAGDQVWAPCPPSRKQLERWEREGRPADERPRTYFRWPRSSPRTRSRRSRRRPTPAPLDPPIHDVEGDELAPALPKLQALAAEIGCRIEQKSRSRGRLHGYYEIDTGRIAIDSTPLGQRQGQDLLPRARPRADPPRTPGRRPGARLRRRGAGGRVGRVHVCRRARDPQRRLLGPLPGLVGGAI